MLLGDPAILPQLTSFMECIKMCFNCKMENYFKNVLLFLDICLLLIEIIINTCIQTLLRPRGRQIISKIYLKCIQ